VGSTPTRKRLTTDRKPVLPELKHVAGYRGGYILRSEGTEEVEFVVVNLFESIEAVRAFAGAGSGASRHQKYTFSKECTVRPLSAAPISGVALRTLSMAVRRARASVTLNS
jgi:hypothetical protein